jgi:hypothetical protein
MSKIFAGLLYFVFVILPWLIWFALAGGIVFLSWFMYWSYSHNFEMAMISGFLGLLGNAVMYFIVFPMFERRHWGYGQLENISAKIAEVGIYLTEINLGIFLILIARDMVLFFV